MYFGSMRRVWRGKKKDKETLLPVPVVADIDSQQPTPPYLEPSATSECVADIALLETLVQLPPGVLRDEWLAWHTIAFAEHVSLLYGVVSSEWCTTASCPSMSAPSNTHYVWLDDRGKKAKCPAPQYTDYVMTYIHKTVSDVSVFPVKHGHAFPSSFFLTLKKVHRFLFHVVAHLYCAHFSQLQRLGLHGHLNTLFAHVTLFNGQFGLVDGKEVAVLASLWQALARSSRRRRCSSASGGAGAADCSRHSSEDGDCESNKENMSCLSSP